MANTITFTPAGTSGVAITVTPVPGTFTKGDGNDDRGGGNVPVSRAGKAANGSVQVVLASTGTAPTATAATLATLVATCCKDSAGNASAVGEGAVDVTGAGDYSTYTSYSALVDVTVEGDSVQTATISWKGSAVDPEA